MKEVVVGRVPPDASQDAADDPDVVGGAAEEFHPLRHVSPPPGDRIQAQMKLVPQPVGEGLRSSEGQG